MSKRKQGQPVTSMTRDELVALLGVMAASPELPSNATAKRRLRAALGIPEWAKPDAWTKAIGRALDLESGKDTTS